MLTQKLLSKSLKKSLITTVPVMALAGFLSTATMIQVASAEKQPQATEVQAAVDGKSITAEQRENLKSQLLAQGKTEEEAEAAIEEMLKQAEVEK